MRNGYGALLILSLMFCLSLRAINHYNGETAASLPALEADCRLSSEACFARGEKFPFIEAQTYDLQLVPGISDVLSETLLKHKREILSSSRSMPQGESYRAFEIAPGIGTKRAAVLFEFFSLDEDLERSARFSSLR